jgi:hypothetical protein
MSNAAVREKPSTSTVATVQRFLSTVEDLSRSASKIEVMPKEVFLEGLAGTKGNLGDPARLQKHISLLAERIKQIQEKLHEKAVERRVLVSQRHRAEVAMEKLVKQGELLPPGPFAERIHFTRQALSKALKAGRVFFLEVKGDRFFPAFFAEPRYERKQLEQVSRLMGELPGSAKWQFFVTPKGSLEGVTPLDALAKGQYSTVRTAAESFAQR